ncbi:hypothetical protein [Variovorax sp. PBL-E5]|uniref:hypothetical protein n=1 Tax=Variovorax sp. PBL-E5 TaxID=434014 RepID=UPI0013A54EB6|nr:hypothetical protein [Variovorax sp. PBL-E5]
MPRRFALVLLWVSAFWQALTMGGYVLTIGGATDIGHAVLHWQEKPHHHHADGSVSQNSSAESAHHMAADGSLGDAAVPPTRLMLPRIDPVRPVAAEEPALPWPYLDGLQRPPRQAT